MVGSKENRDVERRVSAEAITVVKNENNVLPLNPKAGEKVLLVAPYDNELPGMRFGLNRLMKEGKVDSVELDTYCYLKESEITDELKSKIDEADYVIVLSEMGNYTHLNSTHWITAIPNAVTSYANELNKDSVVVSIGKPYDVAAHKNAKAEVIAYGYKGMDPTEADGGLSPVQAFGPNIPAAIEVVFGGSEARGTLPVSIPTVNENGVANLDVNAFEYGYGITNLTSVGTTTIEAPAEVKSGEEIEVKVNINDIKGLKSENYLGKINFNSDAFEVVSVKSADENVEVKNVEVKDSEINVSLSDKSIEKSIESQTSLVVTLKAIAEEGQAVNIIHSVEIVDSKDRTFNTTLENRYIDIIKVEVPEEENKPGNEENKPDDGNKPGNEEKPGDTNKPETNNNNGGKLPNTGAVVTPIATGALGLAMTALGFVLNKKRNKK